MPSAIAAGWRSFRHSLVGVAQTDADGWRSMFGGHAETDAGRRFADADAFRYAPVWGIVSMISGDVAKLPLELYRRAGDGFREAVEGEKAYELVRFRPNEFQTPFAFWRTLAIHACLWSNGYALIERARDGLTPTALYNLLPDRTYPEWIAGRLYYRTTFGHIGGDHRVELIPAEDVLAVPGLSFDGISGRCLIHEARDSWALGLEQQRYAAEFIARGGQHAGVLEIPASANPEAADKLEVGWRKRYETAKSWFKTVILRDGARFHATSSTARDSQFLESREHQVRDVARWFAVPPSRLGLADSVSYNSQAESNRAYLDSALDPILCGIAQECCAKLLRPSQIKKRFFEHDTSRLLRMNPLQDAQTQAILRRNGALTANEWRRRVYLPPLPGGDELFGGAPKSPGGADKGENDKPRGPADGEAPDDEANDAAKDDDGERTRRHNVRRVLYPLAERAREKARKASSWTEFVDGGMPQFRVRAAELVGDDEIVERVLELFRELADVGMLDLPEEVDRVMQQLAEEYDQ
ncbi:MAG: phage portal protein [Planctomycetota bacterium]